MSAKEANPHDLLIEEEIQEDEFNIKHENNKSRLSLLKRKQLAKEKESLSKTMRNNEIMAAKVSKSKKLSIDIDIKDTHMNESNKAFNVKESLEKSRQIYKYLIEKKNMWKPNHLEMNFLKTQFKKNRYPTKEEKLAMISSLEQNLKSKVELTQLNKWFKNEREKFMKENSDDIVKNTYKKFSHEELRFLRENFAHNTYPKTEEMKTISKKLNVSLSKIENWYKHNRRSLAKKGFFVLKTKKYFKKEEINYLIKMFETHPRPSKQLVLEMAQNLECSESQIKNWYSNKRKKQKSLNKKQGDHKKSNLKEELEIHSTPSLSSKDSKDYISSPSCDLPASSNSNQSISLTSIEKSPSTIKAQFPQLSQSQGFKVYSSLQNRESPLEKPIPSLIIPTPCTLNSPIPQLKTNGFENYNKLLHHEDKNVPLKDTITKINLVSKNSPETSPSFLSSLSNKVQTSSQISPSFRFNTSANINSDISKLISPNSLNQLKNSLNILANKGKSNISPTNTPNIQSIFNNSSINTKVQKLGELEDSMRLKYLANLCSLNSGENLFNTFAYPQFFNNPNYFLQHASRLHTCLGEQVSKTIPLLSHSIFSDLRSTENNEFRSRILEKDIEIRKA